jgi:hypothetical protein
MKTGTMRLSSNVTRAEFAKILVSASSAKDSGAAVSMSPPLRTFPYTNWAAAYIKAAAVNKWVTGYLDGTYPPGTISRWKRP